MMLSAIAVPSFAFAHETQQFRIGEETYQFIVGSVGEPVVVDDKSGVHLEISLATASAHVDESVPHSDEGAVAGLENTLKVEVIAGDKKKVFDLRPAFGEPGTYSATFFPTVQTSLTYRFFGTIDEVPVDLSFTCNPAGHPTTSEDKTEVEMSEGVTRALKRGAFGCPMAKADLGFPEPSTSLNELSGGSAWSMAALAIGIIAFVLSLAAYRRRGTAGGN